MTVLIRRAVRPAACAGLLLFFAPSVWAQAADEAVLVNSTETDTSEGAADESKRSRFPSFGAGIKAGTLGAGLDVSVRIKPILNLRLNLNRFGYDYEDVETHSASDDSGNFSTDGTETTTAKVDLATTGLLLDYHPWAGTFRVSAGFYSQGSKVTGQIDGEILDQEVGDRRYDIVGTAYGKLSMAKTQPYLGIGWGNTPREGFPLSVSLDLGVLLNPKAKVTSTVEGTITDLETGESYDLNDVDQQEVQDFQDNLAEEIAEANDEIDDNFKVYPVVSFGLNYRFM